MTGLEKEKPLISIRGLDHVYGQSGGMRREALRGISADIFPGDFIAVIGANGSGKSTLARHMNALLVPTAGVVKVAGLETGQPANVQAIRRLVGMVFQNPDNQVAGATVEEDVAFGPENLGLAPQEVKKRVADALAWVELGELAHRPPHTLSGGQKQLLAFAGILAMQPQCIVLDEPTSMLDPKSRHVIMDLLVRLNREHQTAIMLVTHFMEEAIAAHRVWVMDSGQLTLNGTAARVFSRREYLESLGLELPAARQLVHLLEQKGLSLPQSEKVFFADHLVEKLAYVL